ncbi:MAG: 30S ribosomal protein S6 [Candidatus Schekmanbacteria bacterium]|nr:30S ribosomal protein S6 [Candidatus Schekmanbacteria bacterium]
MKEYEGLILLEPNLEEAGLDDLVGKFTANITKRNGEIILVEKWGKRPLSYEIKKHSRAHYVLIVFKTAPENVKTLDRQLKLSEQVIRYLITCKEADNPKKAQEFAQ